MYFLKERRFIQIDFVPPTMKWKKEIFILNPITFYSKKTLSRVAEKLFAWSQSHFHLNSFSWINSANCLFIFSYYYLFVVYTFCLCFISKNHLLVSCSSFYISTRLKVELKAIKTYHSDNKSFVILDMVIAHFLWNVNMSFVTAHIMLDILSTPRNFVLLLCKTCFC